jgi:hypothetical protein
VRIDEDGHPSHQASVLVQLPRHQDESAAKRELDS